MKVRTPFWALIAALGLTLSATALAEDTNAPAAPAAGATNAPAAPKAKKKNGTPTGQGAYPFHGVVASVDAKAVSFTLQSKDKPRVITVGSESRLEKDGKPATLGDVTAGDYVKGRLEKKGGVEVLVKGTFGPQPPKKKKTATAE